MDPFQVVREFEYALCDYTGAGFAVCTTSCTSALLVALQWFRETRPSLSVEIPKLTYVGVGMSVLNSGHELRFRDDDWQGEYKLAPYPLWDAARRFTSNMYRPGKMQCVSFHWSKILGVSQGGAILHDDPVADKYLRRARFDGRREGCHPKDDTFDIVGHHCYLAPSTAAEALTRLAWLPKDNRDLPRSDYSDLSLAPVFNRKQTGMPIPTAQYDFEEYLHKFEEQLKDIYYSGAD